MNSIISIVTPVHGESTKYLAEAYESLKSQTLPAGWSWEWLIQEDGQDGEAAKFVADDPRIRISSSRRGGPHVARTMALARATGQFVKNLDSDDVLTASALARDIAVLLENPDVGWVTSRVLDLLPDGSTVGFDQDPPHGVIERGAVLAHWRSHNYRAQVHPATICIRRELVLALGGWMALPSSGDTGLLMAADAVAEGFFVEETGLLYRKWPGQITNHPDHHNDEWVTRMQVIEARAECLAALFSGRRVSL